jgi:multidrug efflux system membrane fusion protein
VELPENTLAGAPATQPAAATPSPATAPASPAPAATQPAPAVASPARRVGELSFLDNSVQDASGTVKLRATVPNRDRHFWPGQFVNVRLVLFEKKDAVLIPQPSVQIGQAGTFVYVVKKDDTVEMRPITLGQRQGELVVIDKGLNPGERVVVTGQMMLAPGAKVKAEIVPPPAGPQVAEGKP